jgi:uncharacterized protein
MSCPVRLIRDWYARLAEGDIAGALSRLAPDVEWVEAESSPYGRPGPLRGREAVMNEVWMPLSRDWDPITIDCGELIDLPSGVLAFVRYRGTRRGTGAQLDAQAVHVWDVEGDFVTRYRGFADTHALQVAMGAPTERNRTLAKAEFEIWGNGEVDRLDELVAVDVIHHDPHDPHAVDGLEGLKASIRATRERFSEFEITVLDQLAEGDRVATRWRATMALADAPARAADGSRLSMEGITIERFARGRVVESWRSMDRLGLLRNLGGLAEETRGR